MELKIAYRNGKKFIATSRGHQITIDQPEEGGGNDEGMTPPELFVAALGSCVGVYVLNYCRNVGLNPADMIISTDFEKAKNPARIGRIRIGVELPRCELGSRREAVLKVAEHCLIHSTITHKPEIEIDLKDASSA